MPIFVLVLSAGVLFDCAFFPVSILKPGYWNFMHMMIIELHFRERCMLKAPSKSAFRKSLLMIIYLTYINSWRQKSQVSFATFLRMRPVNCVCKFDYSAILSMCSTSEYCTQIKYFKYLEYIRYKQSWCIIKHFSSNRDIQKIFNAWKVPEQNYKEWQEVRPFNLCQN